MSRQKKIALFISHIFGDYQKELSNGIIHKALTYGYHVDIFVTNDGEAFDDLGIGEDGILTIPKYNEYRGVIVASGTYIVDDLRMKVLETIKKNCNCPIVNVDQGEKELLSIEIDNHSPLKELIKHLIHVHKYERICFIPFLHEEFYSKQRLNSYKETLEDHNMSYDDKNVYWVDDTPSSIANAIEYFTQNDIKLPDAIVCYNDTIALNVMSVLKEKGYHIPTDIAVTGYDNLEIARNNTPAMTSVEFPVYAMGMSAVDKIIQSNLSLETERNTIVPAYPIIRGSCGCMNDNCNIDSNYNLKLIERIAKREKSSILDMNMAGSLLNVTDIDDGMDLLEKFTNGIDNLEGLYICLYHDWKSLSSKIKEITNYEDDEELDEEITLLKFGIKNKKRIPECSFHSTTLLPEYLYHNSSLAYLYMPLYFKEKKFGYLAVSYKDNKISYDFSFMSWLRNINNMLQRICSNIELSTLVNRLEELYLKDETTQLYNKRGFEKQVETIMKNESMIRTNVMVASFQLNDYRKIADNYGSTEGEFLVKVLANALTRSATEEVIHARTSVDLCQVIALNYDEHEAALYIGKINKYIDNYNTLYPKDYRIRIESSFTITYPENLKQFIPIDEN